MTTSAQSLNLLPELFIPTFISFVGADASTTQINALLSMAKAESDYTADNFLQWFVKEQLEGLFSVLARAICCAWRNSWRERKKTGSLSVRKNDQFEKRMHQTDSMCRRNWHLAFDPSQPTMRSLGRHPTTSVSQVTGPCAALTISSCSKPARAYALRALSFLASGSITTAGEPSSISF
jgi:hypothetical protein